MLGVPVLAGACAYTVAGAVALSVTRDARLLLTACGVDESDYSEAYSGCCARLRLPSLRPTAMVIRNELWE
jgi:hypothetical protein